MPNKSDSKFYQLAMNAPTISKLTDTIATVLGYSPLQRYITIIEDSIEQRLNAKNLISLLKDWNSQEKNDLHWNTAELYRIHPEYKISKGTQSSLQAQIDFLHNFRNGRNHDSYSFPRIKRLFIYFLVCHKQ